MDILTMLYQLNGILWTNFDTDCVKLFIFYIDTVNECSCIGTDKFGKTDDYLLVMASSILSRTLLSFVSSCGSSNWIRWQLSRNKFCASISIWKLESNFLPSSFSRLWTSPRVSSAMSIEPVNVTQVIRVVIVMPVGWYSWLRILSFSWPQS